MPFQVITGKRRYQNMLITKISVTTNKESENVLLCDIDMQEVIFAETYAQTIADKRLMKTGNATSGIQNGGVRSTMTRSSRALSLGGKV